jgi:hypothetical protein
VWAGVPDSGDFDPRAGHLEAPSGKELEKSDMAAPDSTRPRHYGFDLEPTHASFTRRCSQELYLPAMTAFGESLVAMGAANDRSRTARTEF